MAATEQDKHTLHRYFIWALNMRDHFREALDEQDIPDEPETPFETQVWLIKPFMYASYWFATLFVVVEGYRELRLADQRVDDLLRDEPNVDLLRRFRNGIYHYQRTYWDQRIRDFLNPAATDWAQNLTQEFNRFFIEWIAPGGIELAIDESE